MAIGNSGSGSAASRFRPRGTAPLAGLGRRNLLAEEGQVAEAEPEAPQENAVSTQESQIRGFVTRAQHAQAAMNALVGEAHSHADATEAPQSETVSASENVSASAPSSTSTAPSPLMGDTSSRRKRGRPPGSTNSDATHSSPQDTGGTALSASAARARMREIEAELKTRRAAMQSEIQAMQKAYDLQAAVLRSEYKALVDIMLEG